MKVLIVFPICLVCFCDHVQELENAEFIPMESRTEPSPEPSGPLPSEHPACNTSQSDTSKHSLPPEPAPSILSTSYNQKSLNASSISVGLPTHQHSHGLPPSVPPLCLDGLSGSGDSIRLQMIHDRERDEEWEALNRRVIQLQAENKMVSKSFFGLSLPQFAVNGWKDFP